MPIDRVETIHLCEIIRKADGRGSEMKQRIIKAIRQAVDKDDAFIAVRMALTYDWTRHEMMWYGHHFDLTTIDYREIVNSFWSIYHRTKGFDTTFVRIITNVTDRVDKGMVYPNWAYINIFVGDSYERMSRSVFYPPRPYTVLDDYVFVEDRRTILDFITKWYHISSPDISTTVNIYGKYANVYRRMHNPYFEYTYSR